MQSDGDDSSDSNGPDLPAGVLRSRGGWQGDALEIEHQRERMRDDSEKGAPSHAAVDLSQFRNEGVGRGYKAKHVVRQRESKVAASGVVDMSGGHQFAKKERGGDEPSSNKKRSRDDKDKGDKDHRKNPPANTRLESYLQCKGMRDFVKEMSQILKK
ncbi:hypothetical protein ACHAXT_008353 [Thalassiosira profunda]